MTSPAERRKLVRGLVAEPQAAMDVHRAYVAEHGWISQETIRIDLAVLEASGLVERVRAEYGSGFVWLAL